MCERMKHVNWFAKSRLWLQFHFNKSIRVGMVAHFGPNGDLYGFKPAYGIPYDDPRAIYLLVINIAVEHGGE